MYAQVCSRCFGWGAPHTAMIPMADNLNHQDVTIIFEIITKSLHLEADENNNYFTKTKYMNDYSALFSKEDFEKTDDPRNITGRFNRENFEANRKLADSRAFNKQIQSK